MRIVPFFPLPPHSDRPARTAVLSTMRSSISRRKHRGVFMKELLVVLEFIPFTFSALLPVINPIGSAVLFLGFVQDTDRATKKKLARKIASNTVLFLLFVLVAGT